MNSTLTRLRGSVTRATAGAFEDIVLIADGRYRLDPTVVEVDLTRFLAAVTASRLTPAGPARIDALRAVANSYGGPRPRA